MSAHPQKTAVCLTCGTSFSGKTAEALCPKCLLERALEPNALSDPNATLQLDPSVPSSPFTGTRLRYFGYYELLEEIARGGMGIVFKARQVTLNRLVALKLISAGALATEDAVKRFKAEAEAAASLTHPNIVPIHEIGEHQGQHYFSMGLIEGPNLREALSSRSSRREEAHFKKSEIKSEPPHVGCYSPQEAARLLSTIARAVHYAHQRGVLHRDLKPSNILLDANGEPHLTDFGLAKLIEKESTLTHTHAILGTPAYMAPEQARGETKNVTTAADVYGLGALLYEALTGSPPFGGGTSMETIRQVLDQEPRRPSIFNPAIDRDLETICLKCLEKEPLRRYRSAEAFADDLDRWQNSEPIAACPVSNYDRVKKWVRRRPAIAALAAGLVLAFITGIAGVTFEWRRAEHERSRAESTASVLRENLYAADMGLAFQVWESDRAPRARELLEQWRPNGEADLRGFEWRYLYGLTYPSQKHVFISSSPRSVSSALSADDRFLAVGGNDGRIDVWDFETTQHLGTLTSALGIIYSVAFSPDGQTLASTMASAIAEANGLVYLWDVQTLTLKQTLPGHTRMTKGVAFSPDGKLLASVAGSAYISEEVGQIFLWDLASGSRRSELTGHGSSVGFGGVTFSPNGKFLATSHGDGLIRIWDLRTERIIQTLKGHRGLVLGVKFSPDGTQLASGGLDGTVRLWQLGEHPTGEIVGRHSGPADCVAFSPNGKRLVSGGRDTTAQLWDLEKLEELNRFRGHSDRIWSISFAADGRRIVTGGWDKSARLWQADAAEKSGSEVLPYPGSGAFVISPDGRWIIWNSRFWDLNGMTNVSKITGGLWSFSPDGKQFVTQGPEPGFQIWSVDDGKPRHVRAVTTRTNLSGRPAFSPDGKQVAVVSGGTNVVIWATASWQEIGTVHEAGETVMAQAFSPDGRWLATAYDNGRTRLWDAQALSRGPLLEGHRLSIWNLAFSGDGRWLATASKDTTVRLWEMASGQSYELRGDSGWMASVAFSPDGRTLAAGTLNGEIKLWNLATRREMMTLKGHTTIVGVVSFSPDGRMLVSVGGETLRLWKAPPFDETDASKQSAESPNVP